MVLDRFSGGNPTGWIFRAELYFTYLGFSEKEWLPLAHLYLDVAAYDWFQWLYHNNQFFNCKHFTKKLALHFANDFNRINDVVNTLDMMRKLDKNFSYILCKLDNVQRALSTYSQSVIPDPVPLDVDSSYDNNGDRALSFDDSSPVFKELVASDSNIVDECIQPSLQACEVTGGTLEEVSRISTDKMFAGIPDRDIDMEVVDFAYLSELDPSKLSLSLYRFPPAQFKLEFPFDPGSGMLTTFLGSANYYHFMVVDDFKEIIKMFVSHFNFTISDQYTLDQFPYDPGVNVFIVTSGFVVSVTFANHPFDLVVTLWGEQQKVSLLADMAHISGLVASLIVCSPFKYSTFVTFAIQLMGAKVYTTIVLVVVAGSIKDNILYSNNIAQLVLATIGWECATNIVPDSNLEDKVLIEDESIVMSQVQPNVDIRVTKVVVWEQFYQKG
ncbi:hypothetical protein KY285_005206 [Solanum tuberosum]|nr:hypothetical protein KY284_006613 [Solanum tuberosum]KAH0752058.1 hypothetical protein KY285_005206 [Solanum tuberosum]